MSNKNIYHDIAQRTGGDIYIGVVCPVRTGKSTLIKLILRSYNLNKGKITISNQDISKVIVGFY